MEEINECIVGQIIKDNKDFDNIIITEFLINLYKNNHKKLEIKYDNFNEEFEKLDLNKKIYNIYDLLIYLFKHDYIRFDNSKTTLNSYYDLNYVEISEKIAQFVNNGTIFLKFYSNDINDYLLDKAEELNNNLNEQTKKINKINDKLESYTKDILTIMGLFVSIVAIITSNVSAIKNWNGLDIILMNLCIIISITTIFIFINNIIGKEIYVKRNNKIGFIIIVVFIIAIILILATKYLNITIFNTYVI